MLRHDLTKSRLRPGTRAAWTVVVLGAAACLVGPRVGPQWFAAEGPVAARAAADTNGDPLPAGALARLGTTRLRHAAEVTFVGFGPGGTTLVTAGRDNTIRLWDLASGKELRRFARPKAIPLKGGKAGAGGKQSAEDALQMMFQGRNDGGRSTVAVSPDGTTLAAAADNTIQIWEVRTGKELRTIQGPPGGLAGLLFSPDGRTLAGRTSRGGLFLWAADTGKTVREIKPAPRPAGNGVVFTIGGGTEPDAPGMAFTPDGKTLAAAATEEKQEGQALNSVKFWEVPTGKELRKIEAPRGVRVSGVALAPDGKLVAYGGGGVIRLCEGDTGKEVRQLKAPGRGILTLAFSPDGKMLVMRGRDGTIRVWATETGKEIRHLGEAEPPAPQSGVLAFVAGNLIATPEVRPLAISPDGKRIASAAGSTVRLWETATGTELPLLGGHWRAPSAVVLSPDGKAVVSWGEDRVVRRWDAATGRALGALTAPSGTTLAALAPDGRTAAFANADNGIRVHETASGKELHRFPAAGGGVTALAFAPGGKVLAARHGEDTVRLYDVPKGALLRQIALRPAGKPAQAGVIVLGGGRGGRGGPGLAFSPDGGLLVAPRPGGSGSLLAFFDTTTGKELRRIESPQKVSGFAFSPDGRVLATENADRTVTLWEVASAKERARLGKPFQRPQGDAAMGRFQIVIDGMPLPTSEPSGPVGLAFSPDGRGLAVRAPDLAVRVWDVVSGKEVGQFKGDTGRTQVVAFAPDGKSLASGSTDTTLLLWDTAGLRKSMPAPAAEELSAKEVEALWGKLAGADAARAVRAVGKMAGAPRKTVAFLRERVKPAVAIDPQKIAGWVADLESKKFAVRQSASANLVAAGEQAVPALQKMRESPPSLEARSRVEELLDRLIGGNLSPEQLRLIRAVEALERMATPEARDHLRTLAGGVPGTLATREAQAALVRLGAAPGPGTKAP